MNYIDIYFKFPSESVADQSNLYKKVLFKHPGTDGEVSELIVKHEDVAALDIVGPIFRPSVNNPEIFNLVEGWHVNIRIEEGREIPQEAIPYMIPSPEIPFRSFGKLLIEESSNG